MQTVSVAGGIDMKMRRISLMAAVVLILAAAFITGCQERTDKIGDITANYDRYLNKDVRIGGEVNQVYEAPLGITNYAVYRVTDGTGEIWVVSHGGAPVRGDKVGVRGRVDKAGDINLPVLGNPIGGVIREEERKVR